MLSSYLTIMKPKNPIEIEFKKLPSNEVIQEELSFGRAKCKLIDNHEQCIPELETKKNHPNIVFLISHGDNNNFSIRTGSGDDVSSFSHFFCSADTKFFRNSLVLAFSCFTSKGIGKEAVDNNDCLVYLGFDGYIGKAMTKDRDAIIFNNLLDCFKKFILECGTAESFHRNFKFLLVQKSDFTDKENIIEYLKIEKYFTITGDENYVPWISFFVNNEDKSREIFNRIKFDKLDTANKHYASFVKCVYYRKINNYDCFQENFQELEKISSEEDFNAFKSILDVI